MIGKKAPVSNLSRLNDVSVSGQLDGQPLVYDADTEQWINLPPFAKTHLESALQTCEIYYYASTTDTQQYRVARSDTPVQDPENTIVRNLWYSTTSKDNIDTGTWTLINQFPPNTPYSTVEAYFENIIKSSPYGEVPISIKSTYAEISFTGLLEEYPGAVAAYSLRQLDAGYAVSSIRVREDGENTETDIGFTDRGVLDILSLAGHCQDNNGYVVTWYDQSGNGNDATQSTLSAQPKIYDGGTGVVLDINGDIALDGDPNTTTFLSLDSRLDLNTNWTALFVGEFASGDRLSGGGNFAYTVLPTVGTTTSTRSDYTSQINTTFPLNGIGSKTLSFHMDSDNGFVLRANGIENVQTENTASYFVDYLMYYGNPAIWTKGSIKETLFYSSSQYDNRVFIEDLINNHYTIYDQSPTGLLAEYSGAAAAYSLRKLISTAKFAIAVRRASDNAIASIGFTGDELDTETIESFCGSSNGYVATWYDQSGNGRHVTQTVTSYQPKIYDSVTGIILENGKPAMEPQGFGGLELASFPSATTTYLFEVINPNQNPTITYDSYDTPKYPYLAWEGQTGGVGRVSSGNSYVNKTQQFWLERDDVWQSIKNQQRIISSNFDTSDYNGIKLRYQLNNTAYAPKHQEVIIYHTDQSANRDGIENSLNNYYKILWEGSSTSLIDDYSGAEAAYSLRALTASYTGPLVRIRRASDDSETDIYARYNGDIDSTAIEAFCDGSNGYVVTWYDQSGNDNHATQSTNVNQPKIYDASRGVVTKNGKIGIDFGIEGSNGQFLTNSMNAVAQPLTILDISNVNAYGAVNYLYHGEPVSNMFVGLATTKDYRMSGGTVRTSNLNNILGKQYLTLATFDTNDNLFINQETAINNEDAGSNNLSNLTIGSKNDASLQQLGVKHELIVWGNSQFDNRVDLSNEIYNYYEMFWDGSQTGLLDDFPNATAAYDLRALSSTYTGPIARVRRASDNDEIDVYALYNGDLDLETISGFCKTSDGFVTTWYDQSGINNLVQTDTTKQPKIYDATSGVVVDNGKPALLFTAYNLLESSQKPIRTKDSAEVIVGRFNNPTEGSRLTQQNNAMVGLHDQYDQFYYFNNPVQGSLGPVDGDKHLFVYNRNEAENLLTWHQDGTEVFSQVRNPSDWPEANAGNYDAYSIGFDKTVQNSNFQTYITYNSEQSANRVDIESNINNYYGIYDPLATGLLADYPDAAAAYSVRRLVSTAKAAMAVRRTMDNAVSPIGFDADGNLDVTALAEFCGPSDGYVAVWYDQSGNENHAVQDTLSSQPKIYDAVTGVIKDDTSSNDLPAVSFYESTGKSLEAPLSISHVPLSIFVAQSGPLTQADITLTLRNTSSSLEYTSLQSNAGNNVQQLVARSVADGIHAANVADDFNQSLMTMIASAVDNRTIYVNSSTSATLTTSVTIIDSDSLRLGNFPEEQVKQQEVIIYASDQSVNRTDIESNLNAHYSIY